jgi:hypothetical protein
VQDYIEKGERRRERVSKGLLEGLEFCLNCLKKGFYTFSKLSILLSLDGGREMEARYSRCLGQRRNGGFLEEKSF